MDLHGEIARVAYEIYERNGRIDGRDTENWLEAERIVLARLSGENKGEPKKATKAAASRKPPAKAASNVKAKAKARP